ARYDIVVYGATGFTGVVIVRKLASEPLFKDKTIALAGRSEYKLRGIQKDIAQETGNTRVFGFPIIVADNNSEESLANMSKQARVIINGVGPYTLYGEAVIRAAVENGADYVDVSGEIAFNESMALKYDALAREKGVHIVGACGLYSIPADLGTDFLKRRFDGTLAYVETCMRMNRGPSGYSMTVAILDSVLLGIQSMIKGGEGAVRKALMPQAMPPSKHRPPFKFPLTKISKSAFDGWTLPLVGSDKPIIERSQYHDYYVNGQQPLQVSTYISIGSFFQSALVALWGGFFGLFAVFAPNFFLKHAETLSFGMFKNAGPSPQQQNEASFDCFIFGTGWAQGDTNIEAPTKKMTVVCHGPDPSFGGASVCLTASALALLNDKDKLPKDGGVYTTATAFGDTRIFEYMRTMGVTFDIVE
ncbi:hypothetical protein PMAYCL1PPCAC_00898, partial [Pristionchus mayeri]